MEGAVEVEYRCLRELCEGNLEGGGDFFIRDPGGCVEKALEMGTSLHRGPAGNLEGGSFTRDFVRWMKEGSRDEASLSKGAL